MLYRFLHRFKLSHVIDRNLVTEKSWLFRQVYALLKQVNTTKSVTQKGVTYRVPIKKGIGFANFINQYESWFDALLPKLLPKEGGTFVDVGANTGQTLLKVVPHFGGVQYYAVEPNSACVDYLRYLVQINDFERVVIAECALSDVAGQSALLMRYPDDILATTSPDFRKYTKYARQIEVQQRTGDALIGGWGVSRIDVIKVDVEGGEAQVLAGMKASIAQYQPYVLCEILPLNTEDEAVTLYRKRQADQLLQTMHSLGYGGYNVITRQPVTHIGELSASLESSNYLFVPASKPLPWKA